MTGLVIDDCPSCGTMNEREAGEPIECRNCGAHLVPRPLYQCTGCGYTTEGPPDEPPAFDATISSNDCALCQFERVEFVDGEGTS